MNAPTPKRRWCSRCGARYDDGGFHGPGFCGKVHGGYYPTAEGPPPTTPPPQPVRVEEPAGEPVGDETEALRAQIAFRERQGDVQVLASIAREALARVAGLEAREAALSEALEQACDWLADDLPEDPAKDDVDDHEARHALREWRYVLADSGEAGT